MEDPSQQLIAKLQACKDHGLTFYQATQQLKRQGYTQSQITNIVGQFNYKNPVSESNENTTEHVQKIITPPSPQAGSQLDKDYQKLGISILADKERSARPYSYFGLAMLAGYFTHSVYRFWLRWKFRVSHGDPKYLIANNSSLYLLSGAIGAVITIIGLKLYFRSKDKKYKQIDESFNHVSGS